MRKIKISKKRLIPLTLILLGSIIPNKILAISENELELKINSEFIEWNKLSEEEKSQTIMPTPYSVSAPKSILDDYEINCAPNLLKSILGSSSNRLLDVSGASSDSRYNLADVLDLRVENQKNTTECWAFSLLKSMETNIALTNRTRNLKNFSERHMDYATSRTFADGINKKGFNREVKNGGLPISGLAYLTNGQGAVLESYMPFENNTKQISLREIDKPVDTTVSDYVIFPKILKRYSTDEKGNTTSVVYYDGNGKQYSSSELASIRNMLKEHISEYGAITSMTGGNYARFYNNSSVFSATNYNCNDSSKVRDHAITIVGWDDKYSRDNFAEGAKPSSDGAYIVLNSYGAESFDNGYMYVSYEDSFIEEEMYGICGTSPENYDSLYQYDPYGSVYQLGTDTLDSGYIGVVYNRNSNTKEILNYVGITLVNYESLEIYINKSGNSFTRNLEKVYSSGKVWGPGYHKIKIDPVELTGEQFTVIVKQNSVDGTFFFAIEANLPGTTYDCVSSENLSYISFNGSEWENLKDVRMSGLDMGKTDVCIKAFTNKTDEPNNPEPDDPTPDDPTPDDPTPDNPNPDNPNPDNPNPDNPNPDNPNPDNPNPDNPNPDNPNPDNPNPDNPNPDNPNPDNPNPDNPKGTIKSNKYKVKDLFVMDIDPEITLNTFYQNSEINLEKIAIERDGAIIANYNEIVKTGMKIRLADGTEYTLIVRGDINGDGRSSLVDISKIILHYNQNKGFELTGDALKGADMNIDGEINLIDVSRMIEVYNSK